MKKLRWCITVAALALSGAMLPAAPAQGSAANQDLFDQEEGNVWIDSWFPDICLPQEWNADLSQAKIDNAINSIHAGINEWTGSTQIVGNGSQVTQSCGNFNAIQQVNNYGSNRAAFCNNVPAANPEDSIQWESMDTETLGLTQTCDVNNNGKIDWFVMVINSNWQASWHFDGFTDPTTSFPIDFRGVFTHEFGHVIGFDKGNGHLTGVCSHTPSEWNTMCGGDFYGVWKSFPGFGGNSGKDNRTLNSDDIAETNENY